MEDAQIIALFLERNELALSETAQKYGKRLCKLAFGIVQNWETAEECENDTYYEAWKYIPPHRPESYFYTFLAKITRNLSLNRCIESSRLKRSAHVCELSNEMAECIPGDNTIEKHMDRTALKKRSTVFSALWILRNEICLFVGTGIWIPSRRSVSVIIFLKAT